MEIEGDDGSKTQLHYASQSVFGRGSGFPTNDSTVSRRHVLLHLDGGGENQPQPPRVSFEVIGKNPVWVRSGGEVKTFNKLEKGELGSGDWFCISSRPPVWFRLRSAQPEAEVEEDIDVAQIDPVKEFGFLVIGREFERYPKGSVRDAKEWDWFLKDDNAVGMSEEDESEDGGRKKRKKRKKVRDGEEDDDWKRESEEEEKAVVGNASRKKDGGAKYATRLRKKGKKACETKKKKKKKIKTSGEEEEEEDETLGGFIVDDEELEEEEGSEEEEFLEDDEEEDDL